MEAQPLPINFTKVTNVPVPICFWNTYEPKIAGVGISHVAQLGCESPVMVSEHHTLFLHLRPELSSERKIDDRLQVENVQVGDVAIVPAHANHWQGIEQDIAEAVILTLEPQFLAYNTSELLNPARLELLPTFAQPDPLIYGIGLTLKNALERGICDRIYFESLFTSLSIHLLRRYSTHKPVLREYAGGLPKYKLKQAIAYINERLSENLSLAEIAQEINMSQHYFCRLFKQSTGISPYRYIIGQRVERAKQLLVQNQLSIAEVAQEVGFSEQSQLTRHMKRATGLTPKQLRDRV